MEVSKDDGAVRVVAAAKVKVKAGTTDSAPESEAAAMSKLTTFSLELSEEEKRARNRVVMPFWKEEQKAAAAGRLPYVTFTPKGQYLKFRKLKIFLYSSHF